MIMELKSNMENPSFSLNTSFIKIEAEDVILNDIDQNVDNDGNDVNNEVKLDIFSNEAAEGRPNSNFRSARLSNRTSIVTSEVDNIYAKPRMHFTGKGIVTKTQPGYSFTVKTKKCRKVKVKDKMKEEISDVPSTVPRVTSDIIQDAPIEKTKNKELELETEPKVKTEGESYFFIKKKRDRRFPKVAQSEDNLIHPNYYMSSKEIQESETGQDDVDQTERGIGEDAELDDEQMQHNDMPISNFLNKKMFKRVGHYSDCLVECTICYKQMKDTSMKQHFKTHSGAKPFPCNFCGARFTRKGDVHRHRKTIHRNIKPFVCNMCERRFVERKSLITHLQNHDRVLYYECSTCDFRFGKREYYKNHVDFIHPLAEGQSLDDDKNIVSIGVKQLEKLLVDEKEESKLGRRLSSSNVELESEKEEEVNIVVKKEKDSEYEMSSDEFKMDPTSPESSLSNENMDEESEKEFSFVDVDDATVVKGTLSLTQRVTSPQDIEAQEEEELVNKAIKAAVSQAEMALDIIQSSLGNNMSSKSSENTVGNSYPECSESPIKASKKIEPKPNEIHINATVGGSMRKFIVQIPSESNIDATTQEGMDNIVNMVNYLCSGKGELNGPVEIVMHQTV